MLQKSSQKVNTLCNKTSVKLLRVIYLNICVYLVKLKSLSLYVNTLMSQILEEHVTS